MVITVPHLGNTFYAAKAIFDGLEVDYVVPPLCNKKALEIGTLYSPEEMCLPFKIMIGNYIQSIELGADTVLIMGSCGPCRYGEYCEIQINLLKKLGYNLEFIVIDPPKDIGIKELLNRIGKISKESNKSKYEKIKVIADAYKIINLFDDIEEIAKFYSGYEVNKGEFKKALIKCKEEALKCDTPESMINHLRNYKRIISNIELDNNKNPIKIAIIGEIYNIIEPFSNNYIEDKLMDYGVSIKRHLTPSWWIKDMVLSSIKLNSLDIRRYSKKYLPYYIGGHARECIGEAVMAEKEGYDGVIQIFPMGCMPEIVAKSILPSISRDKNLPIMTLVMDEMTGEAGYLTRIEAFIDLLERRKSHVLYGS